MIDKQIKDIIINALQTPTTSRRRFEMVKYLIMVDGVQKSVVTERDERSGWETVLEHEVPYWSQWSDSVEVVKGN